MSLLPVQSWSIAVDEEQKNIIIEPKVCGRDANYAILEQEAANISH